MAVPWLGNDDPTATGRTGSSLRFPSEEAGLTMDEIAEVLKVHVNTVTRDWTAARAWLLAALSGENMDAI